VDSLAAVAHGEGENFFGAEAFGVEVETFLNVFDEKADVMDSVELHINSFENL
jgi:hypothetical protein